MSGSSSVLLEVLSSSVAIADRAGEIVRDVFRRGQLGIVEKTGADDLQTEADRSAQNCILASLAAQYPGLVVVGEEGELDMSEVKAETLPSLGSTVLFTLSLLSMNMNLPPVKSVL